MKIITIEEHIGSRKINEEARKYCDPTIDKKQIDDKLAAMYPKFSDVPALYDMNRRLEFMADNGVEMQVLSYSNTIPRDIPAEKERYYYALANDELKRVVDADTKRFAAFATLPMQDGYAAAKELERCVTQLGFKGALLDARPNGYDFDDELYLPLFEKAAELDVPLSLHPSFVDKRVANYYYRGSWNTVTELMVGSAGFGWHLDVGISLLRLVLAGIFDRYPTLKIISGHWGEVVVYYLDRMQMLAPERTGLNKPIADYYRENVWYTPSGLLSQADMEYCLKMFGTDHIIWSLDYPYVPLRDSDKWLLNNSALSDLDKEKIAHLNAEKLLKL